MSTPETPQRLQDVQSPGAIAIHELRQVRDRVEGEAEQFLATSVIVGAAVRQRAAESDLIALRREAKALRLMTFSEFDQVIREARAQGADRDGEDGTAGRGPSQATRLVNLANRMYHFGVTRNGDAFAVPRQGGYVARMLRGGRPALRPELASAMFQAEGTVPNGSAMTDAMAVLEGQAQQADPVELALRTARAPHGLLLDLGDVTGRAVMVTPDGWEVIDRSPVLFRRTAATLPLPEPVGGHDLDDTLFSILNITAANRPLMKAVLVHHLWPDIGHVITRLTGRDGTAKTWATRILRSLIDPSAAPTRAMPRDETDWIIAVNAALIAAIDNVSAIPDWLSDAMCRASTGEGLMRRKLYSDQDVFILSARRIVILNGIDATIRRADFARRIADFELEQITKIKSDSEVGAEWEAIHPYALGALLDLTVQTLKRLPGTVLASQANRFELALLEAIRRGDLAAPVTSVDFGPVPDLAGLDRISDYEAPHRIFDALLRDSYDGEHLFRNGPTGRAITEARSRNAAGLYHHSPHTLVFGGWDSTGPRGGQGAKYERAITSEIVALGIERGKKTASRIDPAGIELRAGPLYQAPDATWTLDPDEAERDAGGKPKLLGAKDGGQQGGREPGRPSQANLGNVTPSIDPRAGGVTAREITSTTVLSLIQLRRLQFPTGPDRSPFDDHRRREAELAARTALAALGLTAAALAFEQGFDLRSRCVLITTRPVTFEAMGRNGTVQPFDLSSADALKLVAEAADRAAAAGMPWRDGELSLRPAERLVELIRRSWSLTASGEPGED